MAELAKQFVCVRMQSMNGVNLNQFQFEYDLTWMSFFQNAAGRTYLRYGGREDRHAETHMNQASLIRVMRQALALHKTDKVQPVSMYEPVAKSLRTPEDIPPMKAMIAKRKEKCIHCHDVKVAELRHARDLGKLRKEMVFTYPSPSKLGIEIDPQVQFRVAKVKPESPAAAAGIQTGDFLRSIDGQRVLTLADMSRVLEFAPESGKVSVGVERAKRTADLEINLPAGWRTQGDPSWRASTGTLGPSAGFWGRVASDTQRRQNNFPPDKLAMRVTFMWGAWAKSAGVRNGDYVISIDGQTHDMSIRQLQAYLHMNRDWGDEIELVVRRGGKNVPLKMRFPDKPPY